MKTCINFTGSKDKDGYGWQRGFGERKAHRVAYVQANGPVPDGLWVLHTCNNPSCINPDHLYAGTPKQNSEDRRQSGRDKGWKSYDQTGVNNANAKLDLMARANILSGYKRGNANMLAQIYNVHPETIRRIVREYS